jgi:hypothetical protein
MSELLEHDVMVVNQRPKLIELTNEYDILDESGNQIGVIREEGQSTAKKVFRFFSDLDQFLTHRLAFHDVGGQKVLEFVRPPKIFKSTVEVFDGSGQTAGRTSSATSWARSASRSRTPPEDRLRLSPATVGAASGADLDVASVDREREAVGGVVGAEGGRLGERTDAEKRRDVGR